MPKVTGKTIIDLGFLPGPHIPAMVEAYSNGASVEDLKKLAPAPKLQKDKLPSEYSAFINAETEDEVANVRSVHDTMGELMRLPVVKGGAIMPDACPAGTIPVGGVAVSTEIHPGLHSADICCSMFLTTFPDAHPQEVLDKMHALTHFGPGTRKTPLGNHGLNLSENVFTRDFTKVAEEQFGTQGDGNHFAFVGLLDGVTTLVTHHGSRGFGASVFKMGKRVAIQETRKIAEGIPDGAAWIPSDSKVGADYWEALKLIEEWTRRNHEVLHDSIGLKRGDRFWNPHNFVFRKSDGLFYHAKGATPGFFGDTTIVPLNMAEPILLTRGLDVDGSFGFLPHGAGRNYSRSEHRRRGITDELEGIDVRWWCGKADPTEMPSAYKDAKKMRREIETYGLAEVINTVEPYGAIMAGDWEHDAPWRKKEKL